MGKTYFDLAYNNWNLFDNIFGFKNFTPRFLFDLFLYSNCLRTGV